MLPVYDDWQSFLSLAQMISDLQTSIGVEIVMVVVDDGSNSACDMESLSVIAGRCKVEMQIVRLVVNLGHQRAIAIGLCTAYRLKNVRWVVVMDSDGEDKPEDIARLLNTIRSRPEAIVMARRARRSETRSFKAGYAAYKLMFRIATGKRISFGNFCILPMVAVERLVRMPELWNNLAGAIMRSRLPFTSIAIDRGKRIAGKSKMNAISLIIHGLSAMSVYTDVIFVRTLVLAVSASAMALMGILFASIIRLTTNLAIPGWATVVIGDLIIVLIQAFAIIIATTLLLLASRAQRLFIPLTESAVFVAPQQQHLFLPSNVR